MTAIASDVSGGMARRALGSGVPAVRAILGVPLPVKLIGASSLAIAVTTVLVSAHVVFPGGRWVLAVSLVAVLAINLGLVMLALKPVRDLEVVAEAVTQGEWGHRVESSWLADRRISRTTATVNRLLDDVQKERARARTLARRVARAQDEERSRIAKDLHDSTAQTLMAVALQLRAIEHRAPEYPATKLLTQARELLVSGIEELRGLAHGLYPRILEDLGLIAALTWLGRSTQQRLGATVHIIAPAALPAEQSDVGAAMFRVAQEAVSNAVRHGGAKHVTITLTADAATTSMVIHDDGRGFDPEAAAAGGGMGLFAMRDRMSLVGGSLTIDSAPGAGSTVTATAPTFRPGMTWRET